MAMIRPETEMKYSGVQWLGNIPKEWSIGKVKHEFYATKTIVGDKVNDYERLALTLNGVIKRSKYAGDGLQPEKFDGYQILKEHELVFKLIDLANVSTSRVGLSPYTGIVSPAYIVLHHRKDMNPRYGEYYFLSMWMNEVFNHIGGDGVRSALNAKDLLNIPYLKVSPDEQQAIADYLDETCSKIDEIIAEAKASIDEYKRLKQSVIYEAVTKGIDSSPVLVESGIEWVGLIPDTWSVIPNKYVMHKEKDLCEKWTGEDVMSLTMNGVIIRDLQNPTGKMPATFDGYQYIEDGDLLMCLFDIDVTPRCVGRVTHNGVTSPAYSNFKMYDNVSRDYFYYYYLMVDNTKELLHLAKNLRHSFTEEQLGQLKVPMPPLHEQQAIADYLDNKVVELDSLIAEKESLINDLEAYKKSLIYEVVTGKRRVV